MEHLHYHRSRLWVDSRETQTSLAVAEQWSDSERRAFDDKVREFEQREQESGAEDWMADVDTQMEAMLKKQAKINRKIRRKAFYLERNYAYIRAEARLGGKPGGDSEPFPREMEAQMGEGEPAVTPKKQTWTQWARDWSPYHTNSVVDEFIKKEEREKAAFSAEKKAHTEEETTKGEPETKTEWFSFLKKPTVTVKLDSKLESLLGKAGDTLDSIKEHARTFLNSYGVETSYLTNIMDDLIHVFVGIINLVYAPTAMARIGIAALILTGLRNVSISGVLLSQFKKILKFICGVADKMHIEPEMTRQDTDSVKEEWVAQFGPGEEEETEEFESTFRKAVNATYSFFCTSVLGTEKKTKPILDLAHWSKKFGQVKTLGTGIEYITSFMWKILSYAYMQVYGVPLCNEEGKETVNKAIKWITEYNRMLKANETGTMAKSFSFCASIRDHEEIGKKLALELVEIGLVKQNFQPFYAAMRSCEELSKIAKSVLGSAKPRTPPVVVQLNGKPGCGKSVASYMLMHDLYRALISEQGYPADPGSIHYERKIENEFWDGYRNQPTVSIDDYLQLSEARELAKIALEMIHMANTAPFPLHMAAVDDKSSTFFTSILVMLTSNHEHTPQNLGITSREALMRRRNFVVAVTIAPEFARINSVGGKRINSDDFDRRVWEFQLEDPESEEKLGEKMTYEQLYLAIKTELIKTAKAGGDKLHNWLMKNPIAQMGDTEDIIEDPTEEEKAEKEKIEEEKKPEANSIFGRWAEKLINEQRAFKKTVEEVKEAKDQHSMACRQRLYRMKESKCNACVIVGSPNYYVKKQIIVKNTIEHQDNHFYLLDAARSMICYAHLECCGDNPVMMDILSSKAQTTKFMTRKKWVSGVAEKDVKIVKYEMTPNEAACIEREKALIDYDMELIKIQMFGEQFGFETEEARKDAEKRGETHYEWATRINANKETFTPFLTLAIHILLKVAVFVITYKIVKYGMTKMLDYRKAKEEEEEEVLMVDVEAQSRVKVAPSGKTTGNGISGHSTGGVSRPVWTKDGTKQRAPRSFKRMVSPVAQSSDTVKEIADYVVTPNLCRIAVFEGPEDLSGVVECGVFVKQNIMMTAKHIFAPFKGEKYAYANITTLRDGKVFRMTMDDIVLRSLEDATNDMILVSVPGMQPMKDITTHFVRDEDLAGDFTHTSLFVKKDPLKAGEFKNSSKTIFRGTVDYALGRKGLRCISNDVVQYDSFSSKGDCGSLSLVNNDKFVHKILSMHVCGDTTTRQGGGVIITQEFLKEGLAAIEEMEKIKFVASEQVAMENAVAQSEVIESYLDPENEKEPITKYGENIEFIGKVKGKYSHRFPNKTELTPSLLHGIFSTPITAPAMLKPTGVINPLENIMKKWDKPCFPDIGEEMKEQLIEWFLAKVPYAVAPRLLTQEEAINGVPQWRHTHLINMSTARGFGLEHVGGKGKKNLFDEIDGKFVPKAELQQKIDELLERYKRGEKGTMVTIANMKDERLPLEKVEIGNTRGFFNSETAHLIVGRMYWGAFNEAIMSAPLETGCILGMNPHSRDWQSIIDDSLSIDNLEEIGIHDGDAKHYDTSTHQGFSGMWIQIGNRWYQRGNVIKDLTVDARVRECVVADTTTDITMLVGNDLVRKKKGSKKGFISGAFNTAIQNCGVGELYHAYGVMRGAEKLKHYIHDGEEEKAFEFFNTGREDTAENRKLYQEAKEYTGNFDIRIGDLDNLIKIKVSGDDFFNVMGKALKKWYRFPLLVRTMAEIGITYTSPKKDDSVYDFQSLEDLTFLKRSFRFEDGLVYAPMKKEDILEILNWSVDRGEPRELLNMTAECVIREFFHHGKEEFINYRDQINDELKRVGAKTVQLPYLELWKDFTDSEQGFKTVARPAEQIKGSTITEEELATEVLYPEQWEAQMEDKAQYANAFYAAYHFAPKTTYLARGNNWMCTIEVFGGTYNSPPYRTKAEAREAVYKFIFQTYDLFVTGSTTCKFRQDLYDRMKWHAQMEVSGTASAVSSEDVIGEDVQQLTTTADIAGMEEAKPVRKWQPYYIGSDPYADQGLGKVMERKYLLTTISWDGNMATNLSLATINFPDALFLISPNLKNKLSRMHLMRAGVRLEIRVNGTQFHYGKIIGGWIPYNGGNCWKSKNIYTLSTCNAFTVSANTNEVVAITIPYVSPKAYWSHTDNTNVGYFGSFFLRVLNPLKSIGATVAPVIGISVFANFENVELAAPTVETFTGRVEEKGVPRFKAQSGKNPLSKEQNSKSKKGTISGVANAVAGVASVVKLIPAVGGMASAVEGAATLIGGVASAFGYDKPVNVQSSAPVVPTVANNMALGSGLVTLNDMAMDPTNAVSDTPDIYNRDDNEMSIKYLACKPGLYDVFTINSSNTVGQVVKTYYVCPSTCKTILTAGGVYWQYNTPASLMSQQFRFWRGSIKYRFEIAAPMFLVGRLRISWHPLAAEVPATFTEGEGDFVSKVFDFAGDTSINFSIPFLQEYMYAYCGDSEQKDPQYVNGVIAVSIVSAVLAQDSVDDSTVYVNCYMACGEDIDFQFPLERGGTRTLDIAATPSLVSGTGIAQADEGGYRYHLDEIFMQPFEPLIPAMTSVIARVNSGEQLGSILDLLHRFTRIRTQVFTEGTASLFPIEDDPTKDGLFTIFANWFLFRKGSKHYKMIRGTNKQSGTTHSTDGMIYVINTTVYYSPSPVDYVELYGKNGTIVEDMSIKPSVEWRLPHYSRGAFVVNTVTDPDGLNGDQAVSCVNYESYDSFSTNKTITMNVFFAVGDDFSFGWATGCPITTHLPPASREKRGLSERFTKL